MILEKNKKIAARYFEESLNIVNRALCFWNAHEIAKGDTGFFPGREKPMTIKMGSLLRRGLGGTT